jgi:hypothetical protein
VNADCTLVFTPDGLGHGLYTEAIDLSDVGSLCIERATTIEFDNKAQYWRVRDPTGFPLFKSPSRQECLDWELKHFNSQEDMKHEVQHSSDSVAAGA